MNLSAVVISKDEEKNIKRAISSVSFADEILLIDDNSLDKTREIAVSLGAKVYRRALAGNFAGQRNFGLGKARGKWVLFLDADEEISPSLKTEIIQAVGNPLSKFSGFCFERLDNFGGQKLRYGETAAVRLIRLAQKGAGSWQRKVHEYWQINGRIYQFRNPIFHFPHPTLAEFIGDINYMTDLDVLAKKEEKKRSSIIKIIFWPKAKFLYNWLLRLGFLDKEVGIVVSLMMSFHSFLSWSKLWLKEKS